MKLLVACLMLLICACLQAQQYAFIPINFPAVAAAMIEDDEGALWIGAEEGLFRFDGTRFRQIDLGLGKKDHIIRSLAKSEDGAIWASSLGGLFRVRMLGTEPKAELARPGYGIGVDIHGPYVAQAEAVGQAISLALGVYRDGQLRMTRYDGLHFTGPPRFGSDGRLYGACGDFVCEIAAGDLEAAAAGTAPNPKKWPLPVKGLGRLSAARDEAGCLWFRSGVRAGYQCPGDGAFRWLPLDQAEVTQFNNLAFGQGGEVWIPSDVGLLTYGRPGHLRTLTIANGMPRMAQTVYQARDGTIWLGGVGAMWRVIPPERLEYWSERNGIALHSMAIQRSGGGGLLLGGANGLLRLSGDRTHWEPFGDQKEMRQIRAIYPTPLGTTLVSSIFSGLMELDNQGAVLRRTKPQVTRFGDDAGHRVWTAGKATRRLEFGPGGLRFLEEPTTVAVTGATDFARDRHGRIWHATPQGLMRLDPGSSSWRRWTTKDGLLSDLVRTVSVSPDGDVVWILYQLNMMSRLDFSQGDRPRATHFDGANGARYEFFLTFDRLGRLWRGGGGLRVADGTATGEDSWITFNDLDGLPASDNEVDHQLLLDADSSAWLASEQSVYHFTPPNDLFAKKRVPNIFLASAPASVVKKGQPIRFEVGSLYFELRNQLRFRYRLGPDQPWTVTRETAIPFAELKPGAYHFELAARVLPMGEWTRPVGYQFRVTAPVWQTPAFESLSGGVGVGSLVLWWGLRRKRRASYERQKKAFLDALDSNGEPDDPEVERLLRLSRTPTHLPNLSPWHEGARTDWEMPAEVGGRFDVESVVASGGFATVYRVRDRQRGGRWAAVKIFHLSEHERAWMLRRFDQEIEALQRIDHPNVVRFLGAGETAGGEPYLAMDYVEGRTLRHRLADGPLHRDLTVKLVRALGSALSAIHAASVFHRDIKPENLMLTPEESLVVLDFSIAIARDPRMTQHALSRAAGSFLYMAPEQVFGFATPATDIYSFALVVFEMLTGQRAGDLGLGAASGSLPGEVARALAKLCPDLAPADVLAGALAVEVKDRPQDAGHFAERLAAWLES